MHILVLHELDPKQLCSFLPSQQNGFLNMTIHWRNLVNNSGGGGGGEAKSTIFALFNSVAKRIILSYKKHRWYLPHLAPHLRYLT